jgi:hypothetical protein
MAPTKANGDVIVVRFADDTIVGFEHEAKAFLHDLHERMRAFELALYPDETRLIRFWPPRGQATCDGRKFIIQISQHHAVRADTHFTRLAANCVFPIFAHDSDIYARHRAATDGAGASELFFRIKHGTVYSTSGT